MLTITAISSVHKNNLPTFTRLAFVLYPYIAKIPNNATAAKNEYKIEDNSKVKCTEDSKLIEKRYYEKLGLRPVVAIPKNEQTLKVLGLAN